MQLKWKTLIGALFTTSAILTAFSVIRAETVIVHANVTWEMTDIVVQENTTLNWRVEENDLWSFNPQLFPDGHSADGIPVAALKGYIYPGQPIGMLIGRIGDCGRMFPMGTSGTIHILPGEDGEFFYLTMNDDILGLYGKGFKDNEGELIVKTRHVKEK
ncbi:MAG: hypothetical protein E3K36_16845 [Candidatus Brocadia sp.]|nr:hypothetical protein [Candidatus Brocadia sp.]